MLPHATARNKSECNSSIVLALKDYLISHLEKMGVSSDLGAPLPFTSDSSNATHHNHIYL